MEDIKEKGLQVNQWAVVCCQKAPGEPRADPSGSGAGGAGGRAPHALHTGRGWERDSPQDPAGNSAPRSPAAAPRHPTAELMHRRRSDRVPTSTHREINTSAKG